LLILYDEFVFISPTLSSIALKGNLLSLGHGAGLGFASALAGSFANLLMRIITAFCHSNISLCN
jgi:hypothetical protein